MLELIARFLSHWDLRVVKAGTLFLSQPGLIGQPSGVIVAVILSEACMRIEVIKPRSGN